MLEYCACCQAYAPAWDDPVYAEWHVAVTPDGEYLGVLCAGCQIDDELVFAGFVPAPGRAVGDLAARRRAARRRRTGGQSQRRAA